MSDPSEQPPEERAEDSALSRGPKMPTVSPPAFAAVLLVLVIAGVLAWLALSAEKPSSRAPAGPEATVTVKLPDEETAATEMTAAQPENPSEDETEDKGEGEETQDSEENEETEPAAPVEEEEADNAGNDDEPSDTSGAATSIVLVAPRTTVNEIIPLALPDPALLQETTRGALPIIGPDGREPWMVYGRKVPPAGNLPRLAVVVSGLGLSADATDRAINLPKEVTLSFTPYGPQLETDVATARQAGHEVLLDLPMEPISYPADDPGPHTLLTSLNPSDNIARLDWLLGRFKAYVGVINHMGSRFTASPDSLRPILHALKDRGLMFVDSRSTSKSVAAGLARQMQLPTAVNDRFIDHEPTRGAIDQSLAAAEGKARARGVTLVVARPFPVTLERMAEWLPMLESRGIEIVPITAIADKQASR